MGFVTIKDQDGVEHTIHASQLPVSNQMFTVTYGCPDCEKLHADLAAAQRELAARKAAMDELHAATKTGAFADKLTRDVLEWLDERVAELLAQEGGKPHVAVGTLGHVDHGKTALTAALTKVGTQPQYREPTLEDATELMNAPWSTDDHMLIFLKQLGFYRKVQP